MTQDAVNKLVAAVTRMDREITLSRPKTPMPAKGWHRSVCVDVCDLGIQPTHWGPTPTIEFTWNIEEVRRDGKQHIVWRRFRKSLRDESTLRRFLEVWQGYPFGEEELERGVGLVSRFLHRPGMLLIDQSLTGRHYHSVVAVTPMPDRHAPLIADGFYVRRMLRPLAPGPRPGPEAQVEEGPVPTPRANQIVDEDGLTTQKSDDVMDFRISD